MEKTIEDFTNYLISCFAFGKRDFYKENYLYYRKQIDRLMVTEGRRSL